jgi:hypothetical protein
LEDRLTRVTEGLTVRERKFCWLYVKYGNASKACVEAGYETTAPREAGYALMTKCHIATAIANIQAVWDATMIADLTERKRILTGIARGEIKSKTKGCGPKGPVDLQHTSNSDRVKAIAELNQIDGVGRAGNRPDSDSFHLSITIGGRKVIQIDAQQPPQPEQEAIDISPVSSQRVLDDRASSGILEPVQIPETATKEAKT